MHLTRFAIKNTSQRSQQCRQREKQVKGTSSKKRKKDEKKDAAELDVSEEIQAAIFETDNHDKKLHVKREYRNQIKHIYSYWIEHLPKYA